MEQKQKVFAIGRTNFIMLGVAVLVVFLGMFLMAGEGSGTEEFNDDIFSPMRIKVAPLVCLAGYLFMVVAILWRSKDDAAKTDKEG